MSKIFIKLGILLVGLCLLLIINSYKQKLNHDKEMATQTTILFFNSLAKHDLESAIKYVWPDARLHEDLKSSERFLSFKDSKILEVVRINSVHDKFHRTLILSGFCLLKIAKISLNSSFFPKPIKR